MGDLLVALGVAFLAEMGDKSQVLVIAFASRYRPLPVLAGLIGASAVAMGLSALAGDLLGTALPGTAIALGAATLFAVFGVLTLLGGDEEEDPVFAPSRFRGAAAAIVFAALLLSELGDKTMFATITLAARQSAFQTWIGASAGMALASLLALVVGNLLGRRLPMALLRRGAGLTFLVFAIVLAAEALRLA